jgi:hypothetical protein
MAAVAEGAMARPSLSYDEAMKMLRDKCSLEAFQERMLLERDLINWHLQRSPAVLRHVLLRDESAPFVSGVDVSLLPPGFMGGYASLSKWREHELRMDLRYLMLSWRRGFVVSRLRIEIHLSITSTLASFGTPLA